MKVETRISGEVERLFKEDILKTGKTSYVLMKEILIDSYKEPIENPITHLDDIGQTGNFEQDVIAIDQSGISNKMIKKALEELDHQKKIKNTMKKGGAFHEENAMLDIGSMMRHGKPNYHEVKYHMDWWYNVGLLTNALARRGLKLGKKYTMWRAAFEKRNEPTKSLSTYQDAILRQRTGTKLKKKVFH